MSQLETFHKILHDNGVSITKSRNLVFDALKSDSPQTMSELITKTSGEVDRVTVYRVIDLLENLGIVHRITIGWKYKLELSDQFLGHHHHITCLGCGKIVALSETNEFENLINQLGTNAGFEVASHQFELQGYCIDCKPK